jgi:peptidoglycan/xylan/chitin deacetylase (PgdA/CDA1 family)
MNALLRAAFGALSPSGERVRLQTLIFHRVMTTPDPLQPGEMHASHFDDVCRWLRAWFNVLPLSEAVSRLKARSLPPRALAITFDDGYADNHDVALPILQRHGLQATFFIATGFLDGGRMWNDTVIEAVRGCSAEQLDLRGLAGLGATSLPLRSVGERRAAISHLLMRTKYLALNERQALVSGIAERAGAALPHDLMMRSAQVVALHRAGMQVGAHTVSHPILSRLDDPAARAEVLDGKAALEALVGEPVRLFAYPNGKPGQDYGTAARSIVAAAGFDAAVTTSPGVASADSDLWQLPRFTPWDRDRARFALRLARNLGARPAARSMPAGGTA